MVRELNSQQFLGFAKKPSDEVCPGLGQDDIH